MREGILLFNKPQGKTSFFLVSLLRKHSQIKTIGHAGTLDPFATGVMVMLIGKPYTRLAEKFQSHDKSYRATLTLGKETDTYDLEGSVTRTSDLIPISEQIQTVLKDFQGTRQQVPPMFSAVKVGGKKLYDLARQGKTIERKAKTITLKTTLVDYSYPKLTLDIDCSKGTYIRSIAQEIGEKLGCYAFTSKLTRLRSGPFELKDCIQVPEKGSDFDYRDHLRCAP